MKRWSRFLQVGALSLAMAVAPSAAQARIESSAAAHVAVTVPDAWATTTQGNSVIVRAPGGGMAIEFHHVTRAAEIVAARSQFEAVINRNFETARYDGPARPVVQNGMRGLIRRGHGQLNGTDVGFIGGFLAHEAGGVVVIAWVTRDGVAANGAVLEAVLDSVRPQ